MLKNVFAMLSEKNTMEFLFAKRSQLSLKGIPTQPREFTQERRQKAEEYKRKVHRSPNVYGEIGSYGWKIGLLSQLDEPGVVAWEDVEEWIQNPEVLAFFMDGTQGQDSCTKSADNITELQTESSGRIIQSEKTKTNELQGKGDPMEVEGLSPVPKQKEVVTTPQPNELAITSMDASIKATPHPPVSAHPQMCHRLNIAVLPSRNSVFIRAQSSSRKASTGTLQPPKASIIPTSSESTELGKPEVDNNPDDMDVVFLCEKPLKRRNFKKQSNSQSGGPPKKNWKHISHLGIHSTAPSGQASRSTIKCNKSRSLFGPSMSTPIFGNKAQPQPQLFGHTPKYSYYQHSYPTSSYYGGYSDPSLGRIYHPLPQFPTGCQPSLQYNWRTPYFSGKQNYFGSSSHQSLPSSYSVLPQTAGMTSPMNEQRCPSVTPRRSEASSERGSQSASCFSPSLHQQG